MTRDDSGIALMTTMMVMLLLSSLLVGFTTLVIQDGRLGAMDLGRSEAFYVTHAGLEQLTTDLGELFAADFAPSGDTVRALGTTPPSLPGVTWEEPDGSPGYRIDFETTTGNPLTGDPVSENRTITSGPFQGFIGLMTEYEVNVTGRMYNSSESSLQRLLQTVSIPVFQFGTFSETDLSFFPGPFFDLGGRVHTNGNLFLAAGNGLQLSDRVTAVGEIIRAFLSNGVTTTGRTGNVDVITAPGAFRDLQINEGSLVGFLGSAQNEPTWTNLSTGTYNYNITNGSTGAKRLELPLVSMGALPIDLVRRPEATEDPDGAIFPQRYFGQASIRILLSDTAADITSLPTVTSTPPVEIDAHVDTGGDPLNPFAGYTVDANRPPLAMSSGVGGDGYRMPVDTTSLGGFIKIEIQTTPDTWQDVTLEILNLGIAGRNFNGGCVEPNPNAVLRLERLRFDGNLDQPGGTGCGDGSTSGYDYWPNVLYDAREGVWRDNIDYAEMDLFLSGVMHYVELDVNNLDRWLQGTIGTSGPSVLDQNGFIVYFSDRRLNRDTFGNETGEYGFEDYVNPASSAGTPNGVLDTGEDVNGDGQLDTYGQFPIVPAGATAPLTAAARPTTLVDQDEAQTNLAILFRRALKLTNGGLGNVPMPGLTVTSENMVYVQGDFNASVGAGGFAEPNAATAIIADGVTLLSNNWNDMTSLQSPHNRSDRTGTTTWYRVAIVAGKGPSFPQPTAGSPPADFGTDGGTHNFLRYLERWSGQTLNYRGAIITFYYNRQALGTYKCCSNVYGPPVRAYVFDTDFLDPTLLPPGTPMFRDVNILGFTYNLRAQ